VLGLVGPDVEERLVSELDAALDKWVGSVPPHCMSVLCRNIKNPSVLITLFSAVGP
jgi:hypothetical protein